MHLQRLLCHHKDRAGICVEYAYGIGYIIDRQPKAKQ
jgi:hypothetical protein